MRVGSLFSGIGGLELGLEAAGMETVWQVEFNQYAQKVLKKHWPNVARFDDVRTFNPSSASPVDLICGGFPCQPHSLAGKRLASRDERDLWCEFARIIREARPRWVVAENVPGLLTSEGGGYFGRILADLAALGFDAEWFMLSAQAVGAPHRRERLFIVANAKSSGLPKPEVKNRTSQRLTGFTYRGMGDFRTAGNWAIEPDMGRMAHGVPSRVDRLKCLGNAVVPQVAYEIGKIIMKFESGNIASP